MRNICGIYVTRGVGGDRVVWHDNGEKKLTRATLTTTATTTTTTTTTMTTMMMTTPISNRRRSRQLLASWPGEQLK
jgi:hypothetical protein